MHDTRRTRVVLAVLLVLALALITFDYRDGSSGPVHGLRQAGGAVFGTAESVVSAVTSPFVDFFTHSSGSGSSGQVAATAAADHSAARRAQPGAAEQGGVPAAQLDAAAGGPGRLPDRGRDRDRDRDRDTRRR